MSKKPEKVKKLKASQPSTIKDFINAESSERNEVEKDADSSLKFFKSVKSVMKSSSLGSNTSNAVSMFINQPSTSSATSSTLSSKYSNRVTKKNPTKTKKKSQADIRKAWNKQDKIIQKVITESCYEDGLDPEEVQLALALSESMKDQQQLNSEDSKDLTRFENPFQSSKAKINPVTSVLERYGFKTNRGLSEYEQEILATGKFNKRSKFQKVPTLLTRTTNEERTQMIQQRINAILDRDKPFKTYDDNHVDYQIQSFYLHNLDTTFNSITALENLTEPVADTMQNYYVPDMFPFSYTAADYLLKNWNLIPGREPSPSREIEAINKEELGSNIEVTVEHKSEEETKIKNSQTFKENNAENQIPKVNSETEVVESIEPKVELEKMSTYSHNSSCSDIFADVESFEFSGQGSFQLNNADMSNIAEHLSLLNEKLSQQIENTANFQQEEIILQSSDEDSDGDTIEYSLEDNLAKNEVSAQISLISSDEEETKKHPGTSKIEDKIDLTQISYNDKSKSLESISSVSSEVIAISDDEINYSMQPSQLPNDPPQMDVFEIDNLISDEDEDDNKSMVSFTNEEVNLTKSVTDLLQTSITIQPRKSTSKQSFQKFMDDEGLSDSIRDIINKYDKGNNVSARRSFTKMRSESNFKDHVSFSQGPEDLIDLTQDLENVEPLDVTEKSINESLVNIMSSPAYPPKASARRKSRKSILSLASEKFEIDRETPIAEPEFHSMTPVELKRELFKYGVRPLAGKKAIELLEHIYNTIHPKVKVAVEEEIDVNDSRMDLNNTDVVTNIVYQGRDDDFVFSYAAIEGEDYILPKTKKTKNPSCLVPLQIAFYNMLRSNEKLQKFVLEYRPLDLDFIHKHFRKFGLNYQLNDIIGFLDRRCITFKTKDQSYSKTHERKKKKRTQR